VCNQRIYDTYVAPEEVRRLEKFSTFEWLLYEDDNNFDKESRTSKFLESISSVNGLIISHGSPTINSEIMDATSNLKIIGGIMENEPLSTLDVEKIATLPTLKEARAKIAGILAMPAQKIISILLAPGLKIAILAHAKSKKV